MNTTTTTTTTTTEEFTFPILVSATRASIDSPPLWRQAGPTQTASTSSNSTTSSSSSSSEEEEEGREHLHSSSIHTKVTHNTLQRKRFSGVEEGDRDHQRLIETEEDDIMDLLWEDFNEELPKNRNSFVCNPATTYDDHGGILELGCVPNNLSKGVTGGGGRAVIAKNKKLKVVVLAKALKKLFLLQHQSVKKRSW